MGAYFHCLYMLCHAPLPIHLAQPRYQVILAPVFESCVYNMTTGVWSTPPTTGEKPPPLAWHTFTKIDHHRAVVFGGDDRSTIHNDAYVLDMETWVWKCMICMCIPSLSYCVHTVWLLYMKIKQRSVYCNYRESSRGS